MAEIASEFLPPGVLNVVTGTGSVIGEACAIPGRWTRRAPGMRPARASAIGR